MRHIYTKTLITRLLPVASAAIASVLVATAHAAAPGITGTSFDLKAEAAHISQPDGSAVYSWGYGCNTQPSGFAPAAITPPVTGCPTMQIPGPTLIVAQGASVTVTLHNNLPAAAGNTSILFPGFAVTASGGSAGLLTQEAATGGTVSYTFVATTEGTHTYYSGTQGDLQIEMGLYGAIIVLPATVPGNCVGTGNDAAKSANGEANFRLAAAAYSHASACYDL